MMANTYEAASLATGGLTYVILGWLRRPESPQGFLYAASRAMTYEIPGGNFCHTRLAPAADALHASFAAVVAAHLAYADPTGVCASRLSHRASSTAASRAMTCEIPYGNFCHCTCARAILPVKELASSASLTPSLFQENMARSFGPTSSMRTCEYSSCSCLNFGAPAS